jgi:two-component system, chemotaxis family, response regulator Rcp1
VVTKAVEILLVEDNPGDVRLTREAFKRSNIPANINVAQNGEAALSYLRREGDFSKAPRPSLILLDLNMPRKDGRAVLAEIKKDPDLDCIPVIILTSSAAHEDVVRSYKLHASCYITKPSDVDDLNEVVRAIEDFWFHIAVLPTACKGSSAAD